MPNEPTDASLETLDAAALLRLHARLGETLRERGIVRTSNNPTGDYGEYLFSKAFGWELARNSKASIDAMDSDGTTYQIKSRRLTTGFHKSRQLGGIRNLTEGRFDFLAVVLFDRNYAVDGAFIMPHALLSGISRFSRHTNASIIRLKEVHWGMEGVRNVTEKLRAASLQA